MQQTLSRLQIYFTHLSTLRKYNLDNIYRVEVLNSSLSTLCSISHQDFCRLHKNVLLESSFSALTTFDTIDPKLQHTNVIEALKCDDIVHSMFRYLDVKSLTQCGKVNMKWLCDSYIYHASLFNESHIC